MNRITEILGYIIASAGRTIQSGMNRITEILGYIIASCVCLFSVYVYILVVYTLVDSYVLKKRFEKKEQDEIKRHIREFRKWEEKMQERTNLLIDLSVQQQKNDERRLQEYLIKRDRLPEDYFENPEKYINMKVNK